MSFHGPYRELREPIGEVLTAYAGLSRAVMAEGALSTRTKKLIALAIAITRECDGCIASHARSSVRRGVTPEEVAEAIGVAIMMNGGPGTVYGPRAWAAYQEFAGIHEAPPAPPPAPTEAPPAPTEAPPAPPEWPEE